MKKMAIILALLCAFTMCFSTASFLQGNAEGDAASTFVLPASLITIEDEAFEKTAAESVIFSDSLAMIGERAFADGLRLRTITVSKSVVYIADHAFEGALNLTVRGEAGSYAAHWAQTHGIAFVQIETAPMWIKRLGKILRDRFFISLLSVWICPCAAFRRYRKTQDAWKSMRPQDRAELYPIDYRFP